MSNPGSGPLTNLESLKEPDLRRNIPSVDKLIAAVGETSLPHPVLRSLIRQELDLLRRQPDGLNEVEVLARVRLAVERFLAAELQPVINGTGIVVHTNLGRAPLAREAIEAISEIAGCYNNLEYDLCQGERGSRGWAVEKLLALLCKAEAATVVNNCAAALVLTVRHFTARKPEVVISRGELVQIGGGFRIPEILEASGARLREVGTTNQTSLQDYARALGDSTGLVLKVHHSNFHMDGFVSSPDSRAIAGLARDRGIAFVEDLGSGAVVPTEQFPGMQHEPTPAEALSRGAELVTFSADKLFGGPQAGIIAGRQTLVSALKCSPFFRALRCDKLILAGLEATARLYLEDSAGRSLPLLQMFQCPVEKPRARADQVRQQLAGLSLAAKISSGEARAGGGSLPRSLLPSVTLDLAPENIALTAFAARLRAAVPPILGCLSDGCYKLDFRTIFPHQDSQIVRALKTIFSEPGGQARPAS